MDIHAVQFPAETRYCLHMLPNYLCFKAWLELQVCWAHPWICTSERMGTFRVTGPVLPCLWLLCRLLPHMAINFFAVERKSLERLQNIQNIEKGEIERCLILRTQSQLLVKRFKVCSINWVKLAASALLSVDP